MKQAISTIINLSDLASAAQFNGDIKVDLTRIVQAYQYSLGKHDIFITTLFSELPRLTVLFDSIDEPLTNFRNV